MIIHTMCYGTCEIFHIFLQRIHTFTKLFSIFTFRNTLFCKCNCLKVMVFPRCLIYLIAFGHRDFIMINGPSFVMSIIVSLRPLTLPSHSHFFIKGKYSRSHLRYLTRSILWNESSMSSFGNKPWVSAEDIAERHQTNDHSFHSQVNSTI